MSATGPLKWLILLALLFAPLAMIGASPAAAHAGSMAAGHCPETGEPVEAPPSAPADCMIACAGCLPTQSGAPCARLQPRAATRSAPIVFRLRGLHPEAATPPPRFS
ncbi:MAG TPA: hypothetical protein VE891_03460 [Allosphingosinicella sp.]|nr:hypothetical protein [Allosphingosinicella sp.]